MKTLYASTLALAVATTGALAASHSSGDEEMIDLYGMQGELIRSRDITGGTIYTTNEADDEGWDAGYDGIGSDWNEIGEIEDLILSRDGKIIGIVAEVGGFLDIGDKHVMIPVDNLNLVPVEDAEYVYVTRYNEEQLEEMEGIDEGFWN